MKKLLVAAAIVAVMFIGAMPALADGGDYPPTNPPCTIDCDTADTGFRSNGINMVKASIALAVVGGGLLVISRRRKVAETG